MSENEYLDLPEDPEEAFAVFQSREHEKLESLRDNTWHFERRYINKLVTFDEVYDLGYLIEFRTIPKDEIFPEFFNDFSEKVEIIAQKILMEAARRQKTGAEPIVVLDAAARTALHRFIAQIREKLNELAIPDDKREALFNKLNAFAAEVDRELERPLSWHSRLMRAAPARTCLSHSSHFSGLWIVSWTCSKRRAIGATLCLLGPSEKKSKAPQRSYLRLRQAVP